MKKAKRGVLFVLLLLSICLIIADINQLSHPYSSIANVCNMSHDASEHLENSHSHSTTDNFILPESKLRAALLIRNIEYTYTSDSKTNSTFISSIWQPPKFL
jgi:hypothetical protein